MISFSYLLAWRTLGTIRHQQSIGVMIIICFLSICMSTLSLSLALFIMNGFEQATKEKLQSLHPQLTMQANHGTYLNPMAIEPVLKEEFSSVIAFAPSITNYALLEKEGETDISNVVVLRGIDPHKEQAVSNLLQFIKDQHSVKQLSNLVFNNNVLIGSRLAATMGLLPGDTIPLLAASRIRGKKICLDSHYIHIAGIFKTGIDEFDTNLIISSLDFVKELFPDTDVTQFGIKLKEGVDEQQIKQQLQQRFLIDVFSWQDFYAPLAAALTLEKYVMFFILTLLIALASMNIIALLFMIIAHKRREIAILYIMGMSLRSIRYYFLMIGMIIACIAAVLGLACALSIAFFLQKYPFIKLPDVYYVSSLPISINPSLIILVISTIIILSFIATWIPLKMLQRPMDAIRFEK